MYRPKFLTEKHLDLLASLNESQLKDMFFSVSYILQNCPEFDAKQAQEALLFWLNKTDWQYQPDLLETVF